MGLIAKEGGVKCTFQKLSESAWKNIAQQGPRAQWQRERRKAHLLKLNHFRSQDDYLLTGRDRRFPRRLDCLAPV